MGSSLPRTFRDQTTMLNKHFTEQTAGQALTPGLLTRGAARPGRGWTPHLEATNEESREVRLC